MAEIVVKSSSDIQGIIDNLRNLNTEFRKKADDVNTEQTALTSKWEGDASTAFQDHFKREYPNFENFAQVIDEYVVGLEQILQEYEQAEGANITVANQ
jgi:WXG100 family type VII secretion target